MRYQEFTKEADFGDKQKLADDFAFALDHPVADCTGTEYGRPVEERIMVFNGLCALCEQAGIRVPPLEEAIRKHDLLEPKKAESDAEAFIERVRERMDDVPEDLRADLQQLIAAYDVIERVQSYSGVTSGNVRALMNKLLVEDAHLEPVRPDYSAVKLPEHPSEVTPDQPIKIAIVDDSPSEIIKTHNAAAGIRNVTFEWIWFVCEGWGDYESEPEKMAEVEKLASTIEQAAPDIVLMDKDMRKMKGPDVVHFMKRDRKSDIIFVANTGGVPDDLLEAGCIPSGNFAKGQTRSALYDALRTR